MENRQDFTGFRFGGIHSSKLHLVVVSSSNRYNKHTQPAGKDYSVEVPGGDGSYYFGQTFSNVEFDVNVAFESVDEITWRKISQIFTTDKLQDLIFDENPYKVYKAKLSGKPDFKFVCFTDRNTKQRIYKGEGTLKFICYFPYALAPNKYIVTAADYYITTPPEKIIKEHYNISGNMNTEWKGGFPTTEQVKKGELFYNDENGEKQSINTTGYWENVPEWAYASKLLTTPTLDYDQNLIYMPQYSKLEYMNMDMGLCKDNSVLGSRILVYNPGDLSVPFRLQFELDDRLRFLLSGEQSKIRIRRLNVDRLKLENAVDWTGLKPEDESDEEQYKYGKRYFKMVEYELNEKVTNENIDTVEYGINKKLLKEQHPDFAYIVQPIPRENLSEYIKLFFFQSFGSPEEEYDYTEGDKLIEEYEQELVLCFTEEEKQELYWRTLKKLFKLGYERKLTGDLTWEDMFNLYIQNPKEYIYHSISSDWELFNVTKFPDYYTKDFLDIDIKKLSELLAENERFSKENLNDKTYFIDFDKRMMYNIKYDEDMFEYKELKIILNDAIVKGKWFQLPVGWSMIELSPLIEESPDYARRWREARMYEWGYESKDGQQLNIQKLFNRVYKRTADEYIGFYPNDDNIIVGESGKEFLYDGITPLQEVQNYNIQFRRWNEDNYNEDETLEDKIKKYKNVLKELEFLKRIQLYWKAIGSNCDVTYPSKTSETTWKQKKITGDISEWWWYACNYVWANFPPPYWSYAGLVNNMKADYTPRYY